MPAVIRPAAASTTGARAARTVATGSALSIDIVAPPASGDSARRISSALWNRSAGSFARQRR
jgi:hypothetical protein